MNKQESDILNTLLLEPFINQRILAEVSGHSLGVVNRSLKELIKADYLDESIRPTEKAITEFKQKTPQRAIILAAGFGMRMVPINTEMPKGLLEVNEEALIERTILKPSKNQEFDNWLRCEKNTVNKTHFCDSGKI